MLFEVFTLNRDGQNDFKFFVKLKRKSKGILKSSISCEHFFYLGSLQLQLPETEVVTLKLSLSNFSYNQAIHCIFAARPK